MNILKTTLRSVIAELDQSFLIIDALDECIDENGTRREILTFLTELSDWNLPQLHILITSRKEPEIEKSLISLKRLTSISIQTQQQEDIGKYVKSILETDSDLSKWSFEVKKEIQDVLTKKSASMFRWVFCQLKTLQKCLRVKDIRQSLNSLPKDLDETYARILLNIDDSYRQVAVTALHWLAFSNRPLKIEELAEAAIIDSQSDMPFDAEARFHDSSDILTILSSLVTTSSDWCDQIKVELAHFSVQEYLLSRRIQAGPAGEYSIRELEAHTTIANVCLGYLSQFNTTDALISLDSLDGFPLLEYASKFWFGHAQVIEENCKKTLSLSDKLLWSQEETFINWIRLYDLVNTIHEVSEGGFFVRRYHEKNWMRFKPYSLYNEDHHALHYASAAGLPMSVRFLLDKGANTDTQHKDAGTALQIACALGHEAIVRLLLDSAADVNANSNPYGRSGSALTIACSRGNETIIRLLLDHAADVNDQGGDYGNALQAACRKGNEVIVRLLLDHSADVNAQGEHDGNALQAACLEGNEMIVRLLLDHSADVNAQGRYYGNALQAACVGGNEMIVRLLLGHSADVNAQGGDFGNALSAASYKNHGSLIQILLDHGADVNAQNGRYYETALIAACHEGHEMIVRLLLDHSADVSIQIGQYGNALQAPCLRNNEKIVRLLLEHGADVNAQGGRWKHALQAACIHDNETIVRLLLDHGADVNVQGGIWKNALHAACLNNHEKIVRLLLDHGANVNTQNKRWETALQAACFKNNEMIVRLLLDHGADVNAQNRKWGNALQTACHRGHEMIVRLLLDHGGDVNAQTKKRETALQTACQMGEEKIVQLLLDRGANVNDHKDGVSSEALRQADRKGHETIRQLLLDHGAVYPEDEYFSDFSTFSDFESSRESDHGAVNPEDEYHSDHSTVPNTESDRESFTSSGVEEL